MYTLIIHILSLLVRLAARLGNEKAKKLSIGQKQVWEQMKSKLQAGEQRIWIHCASVGEFEQGRPLIEAIRANYPQFKIVATYFSPSGYELRKNFPGTDYAFYLPFDTARNARRFIDLVDPRKIYFVKYELWYHYLKTIRRRHIPFYLVSANFRPGQFFFKWYGSWYRPALKAFTRFFVQNEQSRDLLAQIGFTNATVTGDTRFDRVCSIADQARSIPAVEHFVQGKHCIVAGSTWPPDEEIIVRYIHTENRDLKWIIAPHELHDNQIDNLVKSVHVKAIRYSNLSAADPSEYHVLVIDNIGMLSSLYRYGAVAYIGGGFGKGIHNTLEAAVYGIPVFFGPVHRKFQEAVDLATRGAAFPINDYSEFAGQLNDLLDHPDKLHQAGSTAGAFVASGRGATEKVMRESFS